MNKKSDILLILDLDETLIHATVNKLTIPEHFLYEKYYIYKRPYLDTFLKDISQHFTIGIWSSAGDTYVNEIVQRIKPEEINFEIIWGRSRCTIKRDYEMDNYYPEKRLAKLKKKGFSLEKIIIVDDSPEKSKSNYGNAIHIKEYSGDENDKELKLLHDYLITLKEAKNIRAIEKRGWRNDFIP